MISDKDFAEELVNRLNKLIETNNDIRRDIFKLVENRVKTLYTTAIHERIQVIDNNGNYELGVLGLLNGIIENDKIFIFMNIQETNLINFSLKS